MRPDPGWWRSLRPAASTGVSVSYGKGDGSERDRGMDRRQFLSLSGRGSV